ncbi:hypothetical protein BDV93DRAFT_220971 [Ceratobasidium sp. AG-I]|nr:hypothetical protein BDV93DRAFT_220971 [Ceratobasidium sp. AG-I]
MSKVSTKNRITNVIPLPGVDEIESACDSLARRLDSLIKVANTCKKQEDFTEILSQLQDVKSRFETRLKHKSRLPGIIHAQDRLRAYEDLSPRQYFGRIRSREEQKVN